MTITKSRIITSALIVMMSACFAHVAHGQVDSEEFTSAHSAVQKGNQLERNREWLEAIDLYETSLKKFPDNGDLKYGLRRARVHFGIERRYADDSFRKQLVPGSRFEALELFDDVYNKVTDNYVERVTATTFVAHGTESLYMALSNDKFVQANLGSRSRADIQAFRKTLVQKYWNKEIGHRFQAREIVIEICDRARNSIGLRAGPVVMEFIFGGCNALDEYSNFLTPDKLNDLYGNIDGEFVGLGIEMKAEKGLGLHLINVLPDSPAEQGGMEPGDFIVSIDGQNCTQMTTDEAALLLRGKSGSRVQLELRTADQTKTRRNTFVRRAVHVKSIPVATIVDQANGIGYIRMTGFQKTTTTELDAALQKLEGQGMRALIWDLRANPGGLLDTAAEVLDRFVSRGVVVSTKGRVADQNQAFTANTFHTRNIPLVLLVDGNSASASEIVAGAIRDYNRGTIVGEKTYGKWSVQSIFPIRNSTGLRLTTAKFYSPNDHNYSKVGLKPDITVDPGRVAGFRGQTNRLPNRVSDVPGDITVQKGVEILRGRVSRK